MPDDEILTDEAEQQPSLLPFDEFEHRELYAKLTDFPPNGELDAPAPTASFVKDIKTGGQIEPIIIRNAKGDSKYKYEVIAGNRRLMAARILEKPTIWCSLVLKAGDAEVLSAIIRSNHHRSPNVMADIRTLRRMEKLGIDTALSGLSKTEIAHAIAVSKLEAPFQTAIQTGKMSVSTGEALLKLTPERRKALVPLARKGEKITANMVAATKLAQVSEASHAVAQKLDIPPDKLASKPADELPLLIYSVSARKPAGLLFGIIPARNKALAAGGDYKVYRLTEA